MRYLFIVLLSITTYIVAEAQNALDNALVGYSVVDINSNTEYASYYKSTTKEVTFNLGNILATKVRITSSCRNGSTTAEGNSISIYEITLTGAASNAFTK